jgi:hypothetical protein
MKKSELRQIIKEEISKVLVENNITGTLDKIEFNNSLVYYVNTDIGDLYVSNKLEDELGEDKLNSLIGTKGEWEYIVWDHTQDKPQAKYRIIKYLGKN